MILIDDRTGSAELQPLFPAGTTTISRLDYGDFMFIGNGPNGTRLPVGIERKTVRDLLGGLGRFMEHQLPGLQQHYDAVYVVLEGVIRRQPSGMLAIPSGHGEFAPLALGARRYMHKELDGIVNTLTQIARVTVITTASRQDTARWVYNTFKWWVAKEFEEHRALLARTPGPSTLRKPSLVERLAKELPGIGWDKAAKVAGAFNTPLDMVLADEGTWRTIPGIGKTLARRVVTALQTGNVIK